MTGLSGKRYVVTGTASGIGQCVAEQLHKQGAEVYSLDRNEPTVPVTEHFPVDLSDVESIDSVVARLEGEFDGVLNIAGVPGTAPATTVFAVNFLAIRHLTESLFGQIKQGGAVVIVSSTAGFQWAERLDAIRDLMTTETYAEGAAWFAANPQEGNAYNFSKECTTVYTMAMGMAAGDMGFRLNAVLPGPVETPILVDFEDSMGKDTLDALKVLLGRHAQADEIADAVLFLASDESRWINGHALVADGGITGSVLTGLVPAPEI
jgi:NAD(P)-dependent dehydrogenase (short-subunit alcohol dehydrogenase family)